MEKKRRIASFGDEIQRFCVQIESLARATDMTMRTMSEATDRAKKSFEEYLNAKGVRTVDNDGSESYRIKPEDLTSFRRYSKDLMSCSLALSSVPPIFLCSLVHHYDGFLGRLLRVAFYVKPELLNASQRQLSFSELVALSSVEAAREFLVEKEVEAVIRGSHTEQFDWMESRFGLSLRKDLSAWVRFVEITERRNLFVHCGGVVSSQYISICRKHGVVLPAEVGVGTELDVSPEYFLQAVECLLEIGVKLGHVLWRKLQPDNLADADAALHLAAFDVLSEERYSLAKVLLHFAVDTLKKQSAEDYRCLNLINLAIAHNHSGEREECLKLLKSYDWSASEEKFKLAVAILEHRFMDAVRLMKIIGKNGSVAREDYASWPLFKEFRHRPEFLEAYRGLFGEDFVLPKPETDQPQRTVPARKLKKDAKRVTAKRR